MPANPAFLDAESQVFANYGLDPKTRELQLDNPGLALRAVETGTGEAVLFLHGFGLTTAHWSPLLARLPSRHCIAIDMPGHGGSDPMDFRGVNLRGWFGNMLRSCLDRMGIESVDVVGHSQGAMIGLWLALDAPERVRSLVAIGTPAVAFGAGLDSLRFLARPVIGRLLLSMPQPPSMYRSILERTMGRHALELHPELVRPTYLATHRANYGTTVSSYLREMFAGAAANPQRYVLSDAELAQLHQPALVVWGQDDTEFQPVADAKSKAEQMPNARFQVVAGGHEPWLDELDAPAAAMSDFLSSRNPVVGDRRLG